MCGLGAVEGMPGTAEVLASCRCCMLLPCSHGDRHGGHLPDEPCSTPTPEGIWGWRDCEHQRDVALWGHLLPGAVLLDQLMCFHFGSEIWCSTNCAHQRSLVGMRVSKQTGPGPHSTGCSAPKYFS